MPRFSLPPRDAELIQIVDAALADTTARSGKWLVCRAGCTPCCIGVFAISQLDAVRLQQGLEELRASDPLRAQAIHERAHASWERLKANFPGSWESGLLEKDAKAEARFEAFGNDEPCPVLAPGTGHCELYAHRPMTCRVFGPPVRQQGGLAVCELCFDGASDEEIERCEMTPDPQGLEKMVEDELEAATGARGNTIIAYVLSQAAPTRM